VAEGIVMAEGLSSAPFLTPLQQRGQEIIDQLHGKASEPTPRRPDPRIGVALGGGSARGLTHIPYIEAMDEMGLKPSVIAGTSIGALLGAGWANGMTGAELRDHSFTVLGTMRTIAGRIWGGSFRGLGSLFQNGLSVQLDAVSVVDSFLPSPFPETFGELKIPFYVVATDFQSWHQAVFNTGLLRPAIAGSIAIPTLFKPVQYAHHLLVDGGVVNPLPLDQAADCDILVGIDVNGDPSSRLNKSDYKPLDVWFGAAQIMMHSLTAHMMAAYPPDVYVRPHVDAFGTLEYWRVREIVEHASKDKDNFKRQLERKLEAFSADPGRSLATTPPHGLHLSRK
jgi:NTE family protein